MPYQLYYISADLANVLTRILVITQDCSISATVAYLVRLAKNAHWSHHNVSNQYRRMSLYNNKSMGLLADDRRSPI